MGRKGHLFLSCLCLHPHRGKYRAILEVNRPLATGVFLQKYMTRTTPTNRSHRNTNHYKPGRGTALPPSSLSLQCLSCSIAVSTSIPMAHTTAGKVAHAKRWENSIVMVAHVPLSPLRVQLPCRGPSAAPRACSKLRYHRHGILSPVRLWTPAPPHLFDFQCLCHFSSRRCPPVAGASYWLFSRNKCTSAGHLGHRDCSHGLWLPPRIPQGGSGVAKNKATKTVHRRQEAGETPENKREVSQASLDIANFVSRPQR